MAMDARDIPDKKVDVSFASRKRPKTKPTAEVKHAYDSFDATRAHERLEEPHGIRPPQESEVTTATNEAVSSPELRTAPDSGRPPKQNSRPAGATSQKLRQSKRAAMLRAVLVKLGPDRAMRYLMIRELADESGRIQIAQSDLSTYLSIKSPTALRTLCADLCQKGLITILQEFDAGSRVARAYQLLPVIGDDGERLG